MSITLLTAAAGDPVTLAEAKAHCEIRAANTAHDTKVARLIKQATAWVEKVSNRDLVERTWRYKIDQFPAGKGDIVLPKYPVQSVTSITYTDVDGSPQSNTLATSVWELDAGRTPSCIFLKQNQEWPSHERNRNSITIEFVTGYAAPTDSPQSSPIEYGENVPEDMKGAVLLVVADAFEHREAHLDLQTYENPALEALISANRIFTL